MANLNSIRGLIIEGVSTSGKTSLFNALKVAHSNLNSERSLIAISEHYSQIKHLQGSDCKILTQDQHLNFMDQKISFLEHLAKFGQEIESKSKTSKGIFYIFERFHLNHLVEFGVIPVQFEKRINELNPLILVLSTTRETKLRRLQKRFPNQSLDELNILCDELCGEQEQYLALQKRLNKNSLIFSTDTDNSAAIAEKILNKF